MLEFIVFKKQITILKCAFDASTMAARTTDAAASLSPERTVFSCFLSCKSQCFCTYSSRLTVLKRAYSREFLLDVGRTKFLELNFGARRRAAGPRSAPEAYSITDPHYCISPTAEALQAAWEEAEEG